MDFPDITILVCTYNRYSDIKKTMEALQEHLVYPEDKVKVVVADDSSPGSYASRLKNLKAFKVWPTEFVSTAKNSGWGVNVNNGLRHVDTDYIFFIEDDYVLKRPLDLRVGVAILETKPHLGMIRYRGTAGDRPVFHQFEADIREYIPDWREWMGLPGKVTYLQFDGNSPTLYIYSHGAHLKHRRFHSFYGLYPEGRKLGETEEAYAHVVKASMNRDPNNAPGIVILPEFIPIVFDHIGQSYQHTEHDK